ncbi:MAG: hypothetical protein IPL61_10985 [Myxococcales bacterium]|nr:hypothetical protein [Myxococcales bacterium]
MARPWVQVLIGVALVGCDARSQRAPAPASLAPTADTSTAVAPTADTSTAIAPTEPDPADADLVLAVVTVDLSLTTLRAAGPGVASSPARWPIWLDARTMARAEAALTALAASDDRALAAVAARYRAALARHLPTIRAILDGQRAFVAWPELLTALDQLVAAGADLRARAATGAPAGPAWRRLLAACDDLVTIAPRLAPGAAAAERAGADAAPTAEELEAVGVACAAATATYAANPERHPQYVRIGGAVAAGYLDEAARLGRPGCCSGLATVAQNLTYLVLDASKAGLPAEAPPTPR